jgi:hypothetical protein
MNRPDRKNHETMSAFGLCFAMLAWAVSQSCYAQHSIPNEYKTGGFFIGCQAYTFDRFTLFEAIEKTAQAGGKVIEISPGKKLSPAEPAG